MKTRKVTQPQEYTTRQIANTGRGDNKQKKKNRKKGQECLVRIVPNGREESVLPHVLPEPRSPNLEGVENRGVIGKGM